MRDSAALCRSVNVATQTLLSIRATALQAQCIRKIRDLQREFVKLLILGLDFDVLPGDTIAQHELHDHED